MTVTIADDTVSVEINGSGRFRMALHQRRDLVAAIIADGGWEAFESPMPMYYFAHLAESPGLVIDVGINTGFYAFVACLASSLNFVLGFEPDATVREFLWQNIGLNQLADRISVSPVALSNRIGVAQLYIPDPGHGLIESSSSLDGSFKVRHSGVVEVNVSTLDAVLSSQIWQDQPVSAIKIDVEGHELAVLEGAASTIEKWRPLVFVEYLIEPIMACYRPSSPVSIIGMYHCRKGIWAPVEKSHSTRQHGITPLCPPSCCESFFNTLSDRVVVTFRRGNPQTIPKNEVRS